MATATLSLAPRDIGERRARRLIQVWLASVAVLIFAMVLVGGATRLTGSGLSITEWKPVTGAVPPLTENAWTAEFEKYRATPQYDLLNKGMSLAEFKTIYLWEWGHRFLGRLIGIVYLLPLIAFILRGWVRGRFMVLLLAIGLLGGLQGAIGWIMVASGLKPGMTAVAPVKLMAHLLAACGIFAAVVAVAAGLRKPFSAGLRADGSGVFRNPAPGVRGLAALVLGLVFLQIALGALVAGLDAGLIYNTWPLMDGAFVPGAKVLLPLSPWWENAFETIATVQFNHRMGAYLLLGVAVLHAVHAARREPGSAAATRARFLAALVTLQALAGITTLLLQVPLWAGLLHQGLAIAVLAWSVVHLRLMWPARESLASEALAR